MNEQVNIIKTSKTDAVELLKNNTGKFFGVTFIKKNGKKRTLNAHMQKDKFMDNLGYLKLMTNNNEYKLVDPKNILEITINGNKYVTK